MKHTIKILLLLAIITQVHASNPFAEFGDITDSKDLALALHQHKFELSGKRHPENMVNIQFLRPATLAKLKEDLVVTTPCDQMLKFYVEFGVVLLRSLPKGKEIKIVIGCGTPPTHAYTSELYTEVESSAPKPEAVEDYRAKHEHAEEITIDTKIVMNPWILANIYAPRTQAFLRQQLKYRVQDISFEGIYPTFLKQAEKDSFLKTASMCLLPNGTLTIPHMLCIRREFGKPEASARPLNPRLEHGVCYAITVKSDTLFEAAAELLPKALGRLSSDNAHHLTRQLISHPASTYLFRGARWAFAGWRANHVFATTPVYGVKGKDEHHIIVSMQHKRIRAAM